MSLPVGYPVEWEGDAVLSDGATAYIRPIRPDDADRLIAFHGRQSAESVYYRFFTARPRLPQREVERLVTIDYHDRMAFVALQGDELIGIARYDQWKQPDEAEVAFFIDDAHHGRGIATLLLEYLAVAARARGFNALTASVLPENAKMLRVFRAAGFDVDSRYADGVIEVHLGIEPTKEGSAAIADRARRSEARSVQRIVEAQSMALIGGSSLGSVGATTLGAVVAGGFTGPVYAVNPTGASVHGLDGFRSMLDIEHEVDVAVIAVPQPAVEDVLRDCIRKGVRGVVVVSAGFSETGPDGAEAEAALVRLARRRGLRILGPNCLGVINTDPAVSLNASLAGALPKEGRVAMSTQSGGLGRVLLDGVANRSMGLSHFVALGNKADISGNDLLQYWDLDERTDVVLLHLESLGNPRRFQQITRSMADRKPIVTVAATAHRSFGDAWPARAIVDAMLDQSGLIAVDTLEEMLDTGWVLDACPIPSTPSTILVGNSGAGLRIAAEAATSAGLRLADVDTTQHDTLRRDLPAGSRLDNPVDLTHRASGDDYVRTLRALLEDPSIGSAIVVHAPPLPSPIEPIDTALNELRSQFPDRAFVLIAPDGVPAAPAVPTFTSPEFGARALGRVGAYGARRAERSHTAVVTDVDLGVDLDRARSIVDTALERLGDTAPKDRDRASTDPAASIDLTEQEAIDLLESAGLHPVPRARVASRSEAVAEAARIGYPVVLKAGVRGVLARTQDSGVALDLRDERELVAAFDQMQDNLGDAMAEADIQAMAPSGLDAIVSVHQGPDIGAVLALGRGGVGATPRDRRPVRVLPIDTRDATRLIAVSELADLVSPTSALLVDHEALVDLLCRLGRLADHVPELVDIQLNPVMVGADGAAITDLHIVVARWQTARPPAVRRLR